MVVSAAQVIIGATTSPLEPCIQDIAVPYFKEFITSEHTAGRCKSFGDQVCVVVVDTWWGWLEGKAKKHRASAEFKSWLTKTYPWIRLIYVPAGCTPVAQPMDAGIIAKLKALLRKRYQAWVIKQTVDQITSGKDPSEIIIPSDVPTCKKNKAVHFRGLC